MSNEQRAKDYARTRFDAALAEYAQRGNRWNANGKLTYWAVACGMDDEQVIEAAHAVGVFKHDADIRRGMVSARSRVEDNARLFNLNAISRRQTQSHEHTDPKPSRPIVREYIDAGADVRTFDALRALSPVRICPDRDSLSRRVMSEMQLLAMFGRDELVNLRTDKHDPRKHIVGGNIRALGDWLDSPVHPCEYGELTRENPLTGRPGKNADGDPSYACAECVASHRHALLEFDALSIEEQCSFWAGFIRRSRLAPLLVALVFSGKKSIHGIVEVNAADAVEYERVTRDFRKLFAVDPNERYRLDVAALGSTFCARLAGAKRQETGEIQQLLYVRREWRDEAYRLALNPDTERDPAAPPCGLPSELAVQYCRVCAESPTCAHAKRTGAGA